MTDLTTTDPTSTALATIDTPPEPSIDAFVREWNELNLTDKQLHWRQAEICASITRMTGARTDLTGGPTAIQQFCKRVNIGTRHFSRLAKTYATFAVPLATGDQRLLDHRITFKHLLVAATEPQPMVTIMEALDQGWTANELARMLKSRRQQIIVDRDDEVRLTPEDDDDEPDVTNWEGRQWSHDRSTLRKVKEKDALELPNGEPRGTVIVRLPLTKQQEQVLAFHLTKLASLLGTEGTTPTLIAAVKRAYADITRDDRETARVCPRCGEDL